MGILRLPVVASSLMGGPGLCPRPMRGRKRLVGSLEPRQAVHNGAESRRRGCVDTAAATGPRFHDGGQTLCSGRFLTWICWNDVFDSVEGDCTRQVKNYYTSRTWQPSPPWVPVIVMVRFSGDWRSHNCRSCHFTPAGALLGNIVSQDVILIADRSRTKILRKPRANESPTMVFDPPVDNLSPQCITIIE